MVCGSGQCDPIGPSFRCVGDTKHGKRQPTHLSGTKFLGLQAQSGMLHAVRVLTVGFSAWPSLTAFRPSQDGKEPVARHSSLTWSMSASPTKQPVEECGLGWPPAFSSHVSLLHSSVGAPNYEDEMTSTTYCGNDPRVYIVQTARFPTNRAIVDLQAGTANTALIPHDKRFVNFTQDVFHASGRCIQMMCLCPHGATPKFMQGR